MFRVMWICVAHAFELKLHVVDCLLVVFVSFCVVFFSLLYRFCFAVFIVSLRCSW